MKPRAVYQYGLWLVRGDGVSGIAFTLREAYQRWNASLLWVRALREIARTT